MDRGPLGPLQPATRPGEWAELPPESPRVPLRRRPGLVTIVWLAVWVALSVGVLYFGGVGGWRWGWLLSLLIACVGSGVTVWWNLGPRFVGRGIWTSAAVLAGAVLAVVLANAAPESASRLAARIDAMGIQNQLWTVVSEQRRGHGWCSPQCPEVIRLYRSPGSSDGAALALALAGLHRLGLVKDVRDAYNHQHGPVIWTGTGRVRGMVTIGHLDGRATLLVDFRSAR